VFFDLGPLKLVTLAVLAVVIFGPDKLPRLVSDAMGFLRTISSFADRAKQDIRSELGPDFKDFEFEDLNPKTFVRKQLAAHGQDLGLDEIQDLTTSITQGTARASAAARTVLTDPLGHVHADRSQTGIPPTTPAPQEPAAYDTEARGFEPTSPWLHDQHMETHPAGLSPVDRRTPPSNGVVAATPSG
jgi:sec-independent protein translocase protein TatB